MDTRQGTVYILVSGERKDLAMIRYYIYPDRVVTTYSEGISWDITIAKYLKKHTKFEEHIIDIAVEDVYNERYYSGMKFMGIAKYNKPSEIKRAEQISAKRLKEKYNRLMHAVLKEIVAYRWTYFYKLKGRV